VYDEHTGFDDPVSIPCAGFLLQVPDTPAWCQRKDDRQLPGCIPHTPEIHTGAHEESSDFSDSKPVAHGPKIMRHGSKGANLLADQSFGIYALDTCCDCLTVNIQSCTTTTNRFHHGFDHCLVLRFGLQRRSPKRKQSVPRARLKEVGKNLGCVAATRSDCVSSSKASQRIRPSSIASLMGYNNIFIHLGAPLVQGRLR
jgi:hypothetical protein